MHAASKVAPLALGALATFALVGCKSHHDDDNKPSSRGSSSAASGSSARNAPTPEAAPTSGTVPKTTAPVVIDGAWQDPDWNATSLRFKFRGLSGDDADLARPYSEARFLHDATNLYVALYASDNNIESTDAFDLAIGPLALRFTADGRVTPASPDVHVAVDRDGTLDDPSNRDEEWKLEISIALAKIAAEPGKTVECHVARCDTPLHATRRCGEWRGQLTIE
jgi:hypothetical protein